MLLLSKTHENRFLIEFIEVQLSNIKTFLAITFFLLQLCRLFQKEKHSLEFLDLFNIIIRSGKSLSERHDHES